MSRVGAVIADTIVGSDDVRVVRTYETTEVAMADRYNQPLSYQVLLPVYYRRGTSAPRVGDRIPTWREGATRWAMAQST